MQRNGNRTISHGALRAEDVAIPADAQERKRVLNVLAQRRYRRRRQQKLLSARQVSTPEQHDQAVSEESSQISEATEPNVFQPDAMISPASSSIDNIFSPNNTFDLGGFLSDVNLLSSCNFGEVLQDDDVQNATFADDYILSTPCLDLLRAALNIGKRLRQADRLFDLSATSIFQSGDCTGLIITLPLNLQPTAAQLSIPHHPLLDVLPWPQVRSKLIMLYSLPPEVWPSHPKDGDVLSLVRLVYDMEEGGVVVRGPEPESDSAWEIEQDFFETWWFAFDQRTIDSTNKKRRARGQSNLNVNSMTRSR